jgi:hypothetical protein
MNLSILSNLISPKKKDRELLPVSTNNTNNANNVNKTNNTDYKINMNPSSKLSVYVNDKQIKLMEEGKLNNNQHYLKYP